MITTPIKLLIVEDFDQIRLLGCLAFKRQPNVEVFEAESGPEGFEKFQEINPDIVFTDIMMPGDYDGIELCRKIKAIKPTCPVIIISGNIYDENKGLSAGANLFKTKPFSPSELVEIVKDFFK